MDQAGYREITVSTRYTSKSLDPELEGLGKSDN